MKETENQLEEEVYVQEEVLIEIEQLKSCEIKIAKNKEDWKEFGKKKTNYQSYQILLHRVVLMQMSMKKQTLLIS